MRSCAMSHRGDSGIHQRNNSWITGHAACRIEGMRQDQLLAMFWDPNVNHEARIEPARCQNKLLVFMIVHLPR